MFFSTHFVLKQCLCAIKNHWNKKNAQQFAIRLHEFSCFRSRNICSNYTFIHQTKAMANRGKERIESQYRVCKSSSFLSSKNQRSRRCIVYKCSSNVIYDIFVQRARILTYKHTLLVSKTFSSRVGPIHTFTQTVRAKKRSVVRAEKRSVSCIHNELKCVCICVEFQKFERFVTATRFLLIFMSPYLFNDFLL